MIICVCNALNCKSVRAAVEAAPVVDEATPEDFRRIQMDVKSLRAEALVPRLVKYDFADPDGSLYVAGGFGCVFGLSMVIGGCLGAAVGQTFHDIWPDVVSQPEAFALVGMAGFADPGRFLFVSPDKATDLLWCM